jgi:hypothetical protein
VTSTKFTKNYDGVVYFSCKNFVSRQKFKIESGKSLSKEFKLKVNENLMKLNTIFFKLNFHQQLDKTIHGNCLVGSVMRQHGTNKCSSDELVIINDPKSIVMIQTDKSLYKPNDLVRYQIVAIDDATRPFKLTQVKVDIFDGSDVLVSSTATDKFAQADLGFHEGQLRLAEEPNFGVWTMQVTINGFEQTTNKTFTVKRYTLPSFNAFIDAPSTVAFRDLKFTMKVGAFYSFGKPVKGIARINATLINENNPTKQLSFYKTTKRVKDKAGIEINLKTDLNMKFLIAPRTLVLDVEFEELSSGVTSVASKRVTIVPLVKYDFKLTQRARFIAGLNYHVGVVVKPVSNKPVTTEKPLKLSYSFQNKDGSALGGGGEKTVEVQTDEKANFEVTPPEETEIIKLKFTFDGEEYFKNVEREHRKTDENIQILPQEDE